MQNCKLPHELNEELEVDNYSELVISKGANTKFLFHYSIVTVTRSLLHLT